MHIQHLPQPPLPLCVGNSQLGMRDREKKALYSKKKNPQGNIKHIWTLICTNDDIKDEFLIIRSEKNIYPFPRVGLLFNSE